MKQFNKKIIVIIAIMLVALFTLSACGGNATPLTGKATVIIDGADKQYTVDLKEAGFTDNHTAFDVLAYLADKKELEFTGTTSGNSFGFGVMLTKIGSLTPNSANSEYIAFFHNIEARKDVSEYVLPDETVDGKTLYYSGLGVGSLKLVDGIVLYFKIATY